MPSRRTNFVVLVFASFGLAGAAYWLGYARGNQSAMMEQAAAVKKAAGNEKVIAIIAKSSPVMPESLDALLAGRRHPDADDLGRWTSSLSLQECLDNIKQLQGQPAGLPRDDILKALIAAWAKKDPQGLLAGAADIATPRLRESGIESALENLAKIDPKFAFDWVTRNEGNASTADVGRQLADVIGGYATVNPQDALSALLSLSDATPNDQQIKSKAMEGLADSLGDQGRYADALAMFQQLPDEKLRSRGLNTLVENWAEAAPQNAAAYVASVQDPALAYALSQNLTDTWSQTDPVAAANWALQMDQQLSAAGGAAGQNDGSDTVLANVVDTWAKTDLNAAGQFLNQMPASATKDAAVESFVARAAIDDPVAAMTWVASMTDPELQTSAFMQAARQWNRQDPTAFAQFMITTNKLTDAQKQAVANALQNSKKN